MEVPWPVYKISIAEQRGEKTPNRNQTSIKSLLCNTKTVKMSQTCYFEGYIYSESVITTPKFGVRSAECSSKLTKSKASLRSKYYSIRTIPMIESKCRKMNLYENGLSKIKNYSLRLLQGVIALRDGIGWEIKDSSFEINSSLNKGKEHCTLQWIFYWKILLHHLSFGIFFSYPLTLFLGSPVDSHKEGCPFIAEKWGLSRCSRRNSVSLCFANVNIHESQTPDPHTGKNKWFVHLFCLFLLLQLLAVWAF